MDITQFEQLVVSALEDVKAKDIQVINTTRLTSLFDRAIVASGDSNRQTRALARHVADKAREAGLDVVGIEGEGTGEWVLVDLGAIVVHIMQPATRSYYAPPVRAPSPPTQPEPSPARPPPDGPDHPMKLILVAVGTRMPAWVDTAFDDFAKRMPRELPLQLVEVKAEPRTTGKTVDAMMALEAARIEAALPPRCRRLILDERGADLSTRALAKRLEHWQDGGDDIAIIIGGPDGLDTALKATAHETMRLSSLTLPHALVRVMLAEAIYRAWSVLKNHPYHRE